MCDCYWHKCADCEERIPIHIGDFKYPREDVEAWCSAHVPDDSNIEVVRVISKDEFEDEDIKVGTIFGIRLSKGNLHPSSSDVGLNTSAGVEQVRPFVIDNAPR